MENNIRRKRRDTVSKKGKLVRIRRSFGLRGGNLAGVCEGLGAYFDVQPLFFRLGFVAFSFFSGLGILAYLAMAIALPDERGESLYRTIRERIQEEKKPNRLEEAYWDTEDYQLCDNCDTVVKFDAKFCHHCGHKL